jgi:hypothetical protein
MKDQLLKIYEAQIEALQLELHLTRNFIYREHQLNKGIGPETTQDLIDLYIRNCKQENY